MKRQTTILNQGSVDKNVKVVLENYKDDNNNENAISKNVKG